MNKNKENKNIYLPLLESFEAWNLREEILKADERIRIRGERLNMIICDDSWEENNG